LYYFDSKKVEHYSELQKKIVTNTIPFLKKGGVFVYITCSVFKAENEDMVEYILSTTHLMLKEKSVIKGYDKKADTMFIAVFSS
jgi:16S rRNA (cytosine967-C5)-methyltransferase